MRSEELLNNTEYTVRTKLWEGFWGSDQMRLLRSELWTQTSSGAPFRFDGQPSFAVYDNDDNYLLFAEWRNKDGNLDFPYGAESLQPARIIIGPQIEHQFFDNGIPIGVQRTNATTYLGLSNKWRVDSWGDYQEVSSSANFQHPHFRPN